MTRPALARALLAVAPLLFGFELFESRNRDVEQGNAALQAGKPEEALAHYDKAVAKLPAEAGVHFDRGAALYALSRFEEAGKEFLRATEGQDEGLKAAAFRSLGNALAKQEKHKDAVEAYKRALALRPDDKAAKWNLEIALRKQKEEEEKKKKDKDKDKDKKDDKDKDKKDDKDKDKTRTRTRRTTRTRTSRTRGQEGRQGQAGQGQAGKAAAAAEAEENQPERIQEMLKNIEANPKNLERERARMRAVRRGPPARDW